MTAEESLRSMWTEVERQGKRPSINLCIRLVRLMGVKVNNARAYDALADLSRKNLRLTSSCSPEIL